MPTEDEKTQVGMQEDEYPCLEVFAGPRSGVRYPLRPGKNLIGRLSENDIVLDDSSVSRHHAVIELGPSGATLADQGSRNSTKLAGRKLEGDKPVPLAHDNRIRIGAFQLRFLTQEAPPAVPEETPEPPLEVSEAASPPDEREESPPMPEAEPPPPRRRRLFLFVILGVLLVVAGIQLNKFLTPKRTSEKPVTSEQPGEVGGVTSLPQEEPSTPPAKTRPVFMDFSATPIPAQIFFGSTQVGETPFRLSSDLEAGKWYEARGVFQLPEVGEVLEEKVQFQVTPGVEIIPVVFQGKIGVFKVASLPRDAQLYLEGYFEKDPFRAKPIKFAEIVFGKPVYVPLGRYVIELRKSRQLEGSQTFVDQVIYRREFFLKSDQTSYTVDVQEENLQFFPIQLTSIPSGAKVFIDEKEVGATPYTGTFPLGEHLLALRHDGYFDYSQVMKMEINTPFVSEITLKTSEAGELINRATEMIRGERYAEALPVLVESLNKQPTPRETAQISYLIGVCYLKQKSFKEAEDYFNKAASHPDFKYHARLGLANLTYGRGDPVKALQLLVDVLVQATDPTVRSDAGILFQQLAPLKSVIYVASDPAGSLVFVNGMQLPQSTPLILHDLGVGTYRIEIKKEGFAPSQVKLNIGVSEFRPVVIKLNPLE